MSYLFLIILNMSIISTWLLLIVFLIRFTFKKSPNLLNNILWIFVGFKLTCNFTIESVFSLIPSSEIIPLNITVVKNSLIESGIPVANEVINPVIMDSSSNIMDSVKVSFLDNIIMIASIIWIFGILVMLVYNVVSYISLKHKVSASICYMDDSYFCDDIDSPFILGYVKPRIYLPSNIDASYLEHILLHEKEHLKHNDHIKKLAGMLLLSLHWFNPIVWCAYILFCKDIEIACDERVICTMEDRNRIEYCETLINMTISPKLFTCPLAFAEVGVKSRVKSIIDYKKPAFWVRLVSVFICIVLAIGFLSSPMNKKIITIEDRVRGDYSDFFKNVESIKVSNDMYSYITVFEEDIDAIVDVLDNMVIGSKAVSDDGSTSRDKTHRIVLNNKNTIYIDKDFSTLWIKDNVTPSYSYKIKDSSAIRQLFKPLSVKASEDGEGLSFFDGIISEMKEDEIYLRPSYEDISKQYVIKMQLKEDIKSKLKINQNVRVFYDGNITQLDSAVISDVTDIYLMHKTIVTSNEADLFNNEDVRTAVNVVVQSLEKQIQDNLYAKQDLYTINQYSKIHVYYDSKESDTLCKQYGYDKDTFAIIEKYYGASVLEPTKEEGYSYHFYTYKNVNGTRKLEKGSTGGVFYD